MIAAILYLALIAAGVLAVAQLGDFTRLLTVDVHCRCGSRQTSVICADLSDVKRLGETLSEDCPTCRLQRRKLEALQHPPRLIRCLSAFARRHSAPEVPHASL